MLGRVSILTEDEADWVTANALVLDLHSYLCSLIHLNSVLLFYIFYVFLYTYNTMKYFIAKKFLYKRRS